MFQKKIDVNDELKLHLAGEGERHFLTLESLLPVRILIRNQGITIQSKNDFALTQAEETLKRMQKASKQGQELTDFLVRELARVSCETPEHEGENIPILIDRLGNPVQARSSGQKNLIQSIKNNDITFASGPAGTGKTFLAVAMAVQALERKSVDRIQLVRPAVESGESLGFLPGELTEKIAPYMRPLNDSLALLIPQDKLRQLKDSGIIEISPLAYMRGRTLGQSFVILDEAQNATISQMKMFLTRMGLGSKLVLTGDESQLDLPKNEKSGFAHAIQLLHSVSGISHCRLGIEDVVRHQLVREIIQAYEKAQ